MLKKVYFVLLITFLTTCLLSCSNKSLSDIDLFRVKVNGKWGFIDYEGQIRIPFEYTSAGHFYDGVCKVSKNTETYCINRNNEIVKSKNFNSTRNDEFLYENNETVIPLNTKLIPERMKLTCSEESKSYLGEGMYSVCYEDDEDLIGVITHSGELIAEPKYWSVADFKNGMAAFKYGHNGIDGYIRKDGKIFDFSQMQ